MFQETTHDQSGLQEGRWSDDQLEADEEGHKKLYDELPKLLEDRPEKGPSKPPPMTAERMKKLDALRMQRMREQGVSTGGDGEGEDEAEEDDAEGED